MDFIHFIGIGGIGVSALAQVSQARGAKVSGSDPLADPKTNPAVARLLAGGADVYREHRRENVAAGVTLVVTSAAIAGANPEIQEAQARGIRVVSRAAYLGELMAAHPGPKIAVAGTHGKTTTTGMLGVLLEHAELDPTVFVGGEVAQLGGNVRIGSPEGPFVAEACEAYDSFLYLKPDIAVVTNVEADHLDHFGTYDNVLRAFRRFLAGAQDTVIACADSPGVHDVLVSANGDKSDLPFILYGLESVAAESRAENISLAGGTSFDWTVGGRLLRRIDLGVPGRHNVANALAAATAGRLLGISDAKIAAGLSAFRGAGRRQDILGEPSFGGGTLLVIDDYAHHPTEIRATLEALRSAYPNRKLIAVFQPHLFSRTRDFLAEFSETLSLADALIVTDIYAARETPLPGVRAEDIVRQARVRRPELSAHYIADKRNIPEFLLKHAPPDAVLVFMGAGDIREQGEAFVALLEDGAGIQPAGASHARKRVVVLMGGDSSEREISLVTGRMIVQALDKTRYDVTALDARNVFSLTGSGAGTLAVEAQLPSLTDARAGNEVLNQEPDVVFIALHGKGGEDGTVQGLLELAGIPYTGSGVLASALAMDKVMSKRLFKAAGIPVIDGIYVSRTAVLPIEADFHGTAQSVEADLGYPVFVKPNAGGSTCGCTLVSSPALLFHAVQEAFRFDEVVLIEKYVRGTEITVGVLDFPGEPLRALPVIEIVPKNEFYDYESKYVEGGSEHVIPARISPELTRAAQEIARNCHVTLGCRGVSRTDLIVANDRLYVLEVNTIPGMTPTSLLPQAADADGISFPNLLQRMIEAGISVHESAMSVQNA